MGRISKCVSPRASFYGFRTQPYSLATRRLHKRYSFRRQREFVYMNVYNTRLKNQRVPKAILVGRANTQKSRLPLSSIRQIYIYRERERKRERERERLDDGPRRMGSTCFVEPRIFDGSIDAWGHALLRSSSMQGQPVLRVH